jgi:hypothetical protein
VRNDIVNSGGPRLPPLGVGGTPPPANWGVALLNRGCYQQVADPTNYAYQPDDSGRWPPLGPSIGAFMLWMIMLEEYRSVCRRVSAGGTYGGNFSLPHWKTPPESIG